MYLAGAVVTSSLIQEVAGSNLFAEMTNIFVTEAPCVNYLVLVSQYPILTTEFAMSIRSK